MSRLAHEWRHPGVQKDLQPWKGSMVSNMFVDYTTLWLFNITENCPFIEDTHYDLPIQHGDFPVPTLNNQTLTN